MGKINVGRLLGVGVGIALGAYLTRQYMRRRQCYVGNYSPLIDQVNMIVDGENAERWLFFWNDEERCDRVSQQKLDAYGEIFSETHLFFEYSEGLVEVSRYLNDSDIPEETTQIYLNSYDVLTSIVKRQKGGKEVRWDADINGAELSSLISDDTSTKFYWCGGNIEGVSYDGMVRKKMTYYKDKENYLFPDVNLFVDEFGEQMMCTYLTGMRSRHFLRTVTVSDTNYHKQSRISYLLDSFDRPVQMLIEDTILDNDVTTNHSREFEIKYKRI